jgi:hypothetical protein
MTEVCCDVTKGPKKVSWLRGILRKIQYFGGIFLEEVYFFIHVCKLKFIKYLTWNVIEFY